MSPAFLMATPSRGAIEPSIAEECYVSSFRLALIRETAAPTLPSTVVSCPADLGQQFFTLFKGKDREHFIVLALDARNRLIGHNTVAIGSLSACVVHPREVYKFAILANAHALILCHNHPSGDPSPSQDDIDLTRRLMRVGEEVGIEILDHLIFGHTQWLSFRERGLV